MMTGEETWSYVQPVLIDAIRDKRLPGEVYMTVSRALMAMDAPTIEERKTGRWIYVTKDRHMRWRECSECGTAYDVMYQSKFCPNCGAKMDGKDEA